MLQGLMPVPTANRNLPFVRMFYGQPLEYVWHDNHGHDHTITQAEGGEQGDPLMPALFSLGTKRCPASHPTPAPPHRITVGFPR